MAFPWSAAATFGGAALGFFGQKDTNKQSAREAQKNRNFQERMSNTAIQRRMIDLKLGGINPLLAAKYDATTPAGAMASFGNPGLAGAQSGSLLGNTALGVSKIDAELDQIQSRTGLNKAQSDVIKMVGRLSSEAAGGWDTIINYLKTDFGSDIHGFLTTVPGEIKGAVETILNQLKSDIDNEINDATTSSSEWMKGLSKQASQALQDLKSWYTTNRQQARDNQPIVIDRGN